MSGRRKPRGVRVAVLGWHCERDGCSARRGAVRPQRGRLLEAPAVPQGGAAAGCPRNRCRPREARVHCRHIVSDIH